MTFNWSYIQSFYPFASTLQKFFIFPGLFVVTVILSCLILLNYFQIRNEAYHLCYIALFVLLLLFIRYWNEICSKYIKQKQSLFTPGYLGSSNHVTVTATVLPCPSLVLEQTARSVWLSIQPNHPLSLPHHKTVTYHFP